ncbi:hypothetical protein BJY01DRAFT_224585 [Aspergillus pseudoustus]|uniref:Uncharacterized protein n=1 Tax=Aspergillus pseudoustus TaxID=1810923 RepID=A0ABR4J202_9EURO
MKVYESEISVFDVIALGRQTFSKIDDAWFREYLSKTVIGRFEEHEGIFQQDEFYEVFGKMDEFDKFLGKVITKAYAKKIASIRDEAWLASVDTLDTIQAAASIGDDDTWRDWEDLQGYQDENDRESVEDETRTEAGPSGGSTLTPSSSADETSDEAAEDIWNPVPGAYHPYNITCQVYCPNWRKHFGDKSCQSCSAYLSKVPLGK